MKIVFASNNNHKLDEIRKILGSSFDVLSLADIGCLEELPETSETIEGNAFQKAEYVWEHYCNETQIPIFADDTGLEVEALNGQPGVHSARYAALHDSSNESHDSEANMQMLLKNMENESNRNARFRTAISLLIDDSDDTVSQNFAAAKNYLFEGIVEGTITTEPHGAEGFGYDPIFKPKGYEKTFAELGSDVKNTISHRSRAIQKLADFLREKYLTIVCLLSLCIGGSLFCNDINAQPIGTWQCYWAYNSITEIQPTGKLTYALSSKGLFAYNMADGSVTTFDKMNVLNDCNIAHIKYNPQVKRLLIAYENQNIDLLDNDGKVVNISSLYNTSMTMNKTINHIYINGIEAFLSTGFGVMRINMRDAEVVNTYQLGFNVNYTYIEGNYIYAASAQQGTYRATLTDNLLDKSVWQRVGGYTPQNENLLVVEDKTNNCYWTTDDHQRLTAYRTDGNDKTIVVSGVKPDGPAYNYFGFMKYRNGKLYTCGGGYTVLAELQRKPAVQIYSDGQWTLLEEDLNEKTGHRYEDALVVDNDPTNPERIFVGGKTGLYEFNGTHFVKHYTTDNSPLESALESGSKNYVLIEGMTFDANGNLWVANSQAVSTSLVCLTKVGEWQKVNRTELKDGTRSLGAMRSLFFDSRNLLWFINTHWNKPSFYAYNSTNNGLNSYTTFINEDGAAVGVTSVNDIAEDHEGNIWIATNAAPLVLLNDDIANGATVLQQVKVPRNDGTNLADYLLDGINITCIAVDGGNRKWIGTAENGVYLISSDNMEQIYHFLPTNSNLLSLNIESIAINDDTGEVFFGTANGLCSFMSDATRPSDSMNTDNVYAYPNPVSPDYSGLITVVGLSYEADVKITTSNGVLVASGKSNGGSFTWDGCDTEGRKVASGVYMVQAATAEGKSGTVCKIAIIR